MEKNRCGKWMLLLFCVTCYSALFNLETSPFKYFVPSHPFSECPDNQLRSDLYIYLYNGDLITQGLMPYRDSFDHKGPVLYMIMAVGIFIGRVAGVWLIQTLLLIISACYAYRTARILVTRSAAVLAASLTVIWYPSGDTNPETLSVPFILAALYYFVRYLLDDCRIRRRETFLVGICFGLVVLMKVNLTALWIIFIAAVMFTSISKREYRFLLEHAAIFLLGTALVAAPVLCWLWRRGAFADFIADYWLFNFNSYGGAPSLKNYLAFFCPLAKRTWIAYQIPALAVYFFLWFNNRSADQKKLYLSMMLYLLLSVLFAGIKGTFHHCYVFSMAGAFVIFFAIAYDYILRLFKKRWGAALLLFLLLLVPAYRCLFVPAIRESFVLELIAARCPNVDLASLGKPARTDRDSLDVANWLRENTKPDATINGVGAQVYWCARRNCASCYLFVSARNSYSESLLKTRAGTAPEYIFRVWKREYSCLRDILDSCERKLADTSPEVEKTLSEEYDLVYKNGSYDVYRRRN